MELFFLGLITGMVIGIASTAILYDRGRKKRLQRHKRIW